MQHERTALTLSAAEHDTLAWAHLTMEAVVQDGTDTGPWRVAEMIAAWQPAIFDPTAKTDPDNGRTTLKLPDGEPRRQFAEVLRRLSDTAGRNAHPTGMVFYITAREARDLADRIAPAVCEVVR